MGKLIDTNILIYFLEHKDKNAYEILTGDDICISVLTRMELFAGIKKGEKNMLLSFLDKIQNIFITEREADKAGELIQTYPHLKRKQADALIAATAMIHDVSLVTANVKDFKKIDNLKIEEFKVSEYP